MDEIKDFIATVGFPIAVAAYLLIFMKRSIDKLSKTLDILIKLIEKNIK